MSMYIEGITLPRKGGQITGTISWESDGRCIFHKWDPLDMDVGGRRKFECSSVPPHGGLIDLKAPFKAQYFDEMTEEWLEKIVTVEDVLYGCMVDEMPPTIIPAEEGE